MRRDTLLLLLGIGLLVLAGLTLVTGAITQAPWLTLGATVAAAVALTAGLLQARKGTHTVRPVDPSRTKAIVRTVLIVLGSMGTIALVVALAVAEGEAQGHAIGHLVSGIVALALFAGLAILWQPAPGTNASFARGASLLLLGVAAFGSFLESLGGSGYDAANEGPRIQALAALHGIAVPIGAIGVPGIVLGAVVGLVVVSTWAIRRVRGVA